MAKFTLQSTNMFIPCVPSEKFSCSFNFVTLSQAFIQVCFPHRIQSEFIQQQCSEHQAGTIPGYSGRQNKGGLALGPSGSEPAPRPCGIWPLSTPPDGVYSRVCPAHSPPLPLSLCWDNPALFECLFTATQLTVTCRAGSKRLLTRRRPLCWLGRPSFSRARTLTTSSFTPHPPSTRCTNPIMWQLPCL